MKTGGRRCLSLSYPRAFPGSLREDVEKISGPGVFRMRVLCSARDLSLLGTAVNVCSAFGAFSDG